MASDLLQARARWWVKLKVGIALVWQILTLAKICKCLTIGSQRFHHAVVSDYLFVLHNLINRSHLLVDIEYVNVIYTKSRTIVVLNHKFKNKALLYI